LRRIDIAPVNIMSAIADALSVPHERPGRTPVTVVKDGIVPVAERLKRRLFDISNWRA
jgi:hypothetical protein